MITVEFLTFTDVQWAPIREQVLDDLGVDVGQIINLRERIEVAVSMYRYRNARTRPRRDELIALREDAVNMQASIIDALTVRVTTENATNQLPRGGVDAGMLAATRNYFTKLADNIDRQIEQCASSRDNARKPDRDELWTQLLAIWTSIGGEPTGVAAARFLIAATTPVGADADIETVVKWLARHQSRIVSKITKPAPRRRIAR